MKFLRLQGADPETNEQQQPHNKEQFEPFTLKNAANLNHNHG